MAFKTATFIDPKQITALYRALLAVPKKKSFVKSIGGAVYFHEDASVGMPFGMADEIADIVKHLKVPIPYDVIKIQTYKGKPPAISFLQCPRFFQDAFPTVEGYITYTVGSSAEPKYVAVNNANPPIYHRKELFLPPSHPLYDHAKRITEDAEYAGLFKGKMNKLGWRAIWDEWMLQNGYAVPSTKLRELREIPELPLETLSSLFESGGVCIPFRTHFPSIPKGYSVEDEIFQMPRTPQSTARASAFAKAANVPRVVAEIIPRKFSILDFGAGKAHVHTTALRDIGFNVTAHDFSTPNPEVFKKKFDVVFASNVLNTQGSAVMAHFTVKQIFDRVKDGGFFIANYPKDPRYCPMRVWELLDCIASLFGSPVQLFSWKGKPLPTFERDRYSSIGSADAPVFIVQKTKGTHFPKM